MTFDYPKTDREIAEFYMVKVRDMRDENARLRVALEECSQHCESPRTIVDIVEEALSIGEESNAL